MTGQSRKKRNIDFEFDAETVGFYQSIGIEEVGRSLPYQPWDKPIERFFSTVCSKFSKWFESYTGTLTGSKTYAKRQKDIDQMLERGELLTMEEFFEVWTEWKNTKYHTRKHRGLSDAGEKWVTPIEMFENGPRYEKAAPPREYAAMLLMKAATARVTNQGINKFGTLYTDTELAYYVNQKVNIKWDIDDVTKLYVYDMDGKKTKTLNFGAVGFRKSTKIKLPKAPTKLAEIIQLLRSKGMDGCVKTPAPSVDKDALRKYPTQDIVAVGASIEVDDVFWYEPDREKLERG